MARVKFYAYFGKEEDGLWLQCSSGARWLWSSQFVDRPNSSACARNAISSSYVFARDVEIEHSIIKRRDSFDRSERNEENESDERIIWASIRSWDERVLSFCSIRLLQ